MSEREPPFVHQHNSNDAEGCNNRGPDDEDFATQRVPVLRDGILYIPAAKFQFSVLSPADAPNESQATRAMLYLDTLGMGMCWPLSAGSCRDLSAALTRAADLIEAHATAQADAALARAAQGPAQ